MATAARERGDMREAERAVEKVLSARVPTPRGLRMDAPVAQLWDGLWGVPGTQAAAERGAIREAERAVERAEAEAVVAAQRAADAGGQRTLPEGQLARFVASAERLLETSGHAPSGRAWLVDKDRGDAGLLERRLREALTMIAKCEEDIKYSKSFFYAAKGTKQPDVNESRGSAVSEAGSRVLEERRLGLLESVAELDALSTRHGALRQQLAVLRSRQQQADGEIAELRAQILEQQHTNEVSYSRNQSLQQQIEGLKRDILSLRRDRQRAETQLSAHKAAIETRAQTARERIQAPLARLQACEDAAVAAQKEAFRSQVHFQEFNEFLNMTGLQVSANDRARRQGLVQHLTSSTIR